MNAMILVSCSPQRIASATALQCLRPSSTSIGKLDTQVFMDGIGFTHAYPMKKKSKVGDLLKKILRTLQMIPEMIVMDGAAEETGGDWKQTNDKYRI
jgi:hypothetical protein